jgi:hypothetical protein
MVIINNILGETVIKEEKYYYDQQGIDIYD